MKLLYFSLFCAIILFVPLSTAATIPVTTHSSQENLLEFYGKELTIIAEQFCEKFNNVGEKLLENKDIKEASTPELKEFQKFLHTFLRDYGHFKRFKIFQTLLELLIYLVKSPDKVSSEEDINAIRNFQLRVKNYFADPLKEYEENYGKCIKEKILPKIEDFQKQINPEDLEKFPHLNESMNKLKSCRSYECFPTTLEPLYKDLNASQKQLEIYTNSEFEVLFFLTSLNGYNMGKEMLKDQQFSQLSFEAKQRLTDEIQNVTTQFENLQNITEFWNSIDDQLNYASKFHQGFKNNLINSKLPPKDVETLREITNNYNYRRDKSIFDKGLEGLAIRSVFRTVFKSYSVPDVNKSIQI